MRRAVGLILPAVACIALTSCGVNVIQHDPRAAAASAKQFANAAFIKADHAAAQNDLSREMKRAVPIDKLSTEIAKMHPASRPTEVSATEFEPMPGQRAMQIYLKGKRGDEEFYYRFLMVGSKQSGYKVGGFWRGSGPYPPSSRKPL